MNKIKGQLLEVRKESEALLQKRIWDILEINNAMEKELKTVRRKLECTASPHSDGIIFIGGLY